MIEKNVAEVNEALAAEPMMAGGVIRRFLILHKELDADDGELTRTQKVRRGFIAERYAPLVTALYDGFNRGGHIDRGYLRGWPPRHDQRTGEDPRHGCSRSEEATGGRRVSQTPETLLAVENVTLKFGGVTAINGVSFDIRKGEIRAIIGPNGAGKTSMLNCINGFYHPQEGRITYKGETRQRMRPHVAASQGIARTFQNVALFRA